MRTLTQGRPNAPVGHRHEVLGTVVRPLPRSGSGRLGRLDGDCQSPVGQRDSHLRGVDMHHACGRSVFETTLGHGIHLRTVVARSDHTVLVGGYVETVGICADQRLVGEAWAAGMARCAAGPVIGGVDLILPPGSPRVRRPGHGQQHARVRQKIPTGRVDRLVVDREEPPVRRRVEVAPRIADARPETRRRCGGLLGREAVELIEGNRPRDRASAGGVHAKSSVDHLDRVSAADAQPLVRWFQGVLRVLVHPAAGVDLVIVGEAANAEEPRQLARHDRRRMGECRLRSRTQAGSVKPGRPLAKHRPRGQAGGSARNPRNGEIEQRPKYDPLNRLQATIRRDSRRRGARRTREHHSSRRYQHSETPHREPSIVNRRTDKQHRHPAPLTAAARRGPHSSVAPSPSLSPDKGPLHPEASLVLPQPDRKRGARLDHTAKRSSRCLPICRGGVLVGACS